MKNIGNITRKWRTVWIISLAVILVCSLSITQGLAQPTPTATVPPLSNCSLDPDIQPAIPIKMDSVVVFPGIVKNILNEKEVFICKAQTGNTSLIVNVNIFSETIEDIRGANVTEKSTFEIITCAKNLNGDILACESKIPSIDIPDLRCSEFQSPYLQPFQ